MSLHTNPTTNDWSLSSTYTNPMQYIEGPLNVSPYLTGLILSRQLSTISYSQPGWSVYLSINLKKREYNYANYGIMETSWYSMCVYFAYNKVITVCNIQLYLLTPFRKVFKDGGISLTLPVRFSKPTSVQMSL